MADYPSFLSFGIASFQLKRRPDQLTASVCALEADPAADSPEVLAEASTVSSTDHLAAAHRPDPKAPLMADSQEAPIENSPETLAENFSEALTADSLQAPAADFSQPLTTDSPQTPAADFSQPLTPDSPQALAADFSQPLVADSLQAPAADFSQPPATDSPQAPAADSDSNRPADWEAAQLSTFISDDTLRAYEAAPQAQAFPGINRPVPPIFRMAQVRFLNASTNPFPVDVLVDGSVYLRNSSFGSVSQYSPISDGFHTVTVRRSSSIRTMVFQGVFPFVSGQKTTLSIADSPSGAITIFQLSDTGCFSCPSRCGCYRVANMTFPGSSFDIQTPSGDRVFRNISFGQASPYKQTSAGFYRFFVTEPSGFQPVRELPILLQTFLAGSFTPPSSLASISVSIEAGKTYTTYLIGNTWSAFRLQALTVED